MVGPYWRVCVLWDGNDSVAAANNGSRSGLLEGEVCNNVHLLTVRKRQSANVAQHHCDVCLRHSMRNDAHVQTTVTNSVHAPPVHVAE